MSKPFSNLLGRLIFAGIFSLMYAMPCYSLGVSSEEYEIISRFETLRESDPRAAEKFLTESLQTTRTPPLLFQAALVEANHNRIDKAVDYFTEIIQIDDTFPGAYMNRGRLYAMSDHPQAAIDDLMRGIQLEGADSESSAILNSVYRQLNQPIAAELVLRLAILSNPTDPNLHVQLSSNLLEQGRYLEAARVAEAAIRFGATGVAPWVIAANALISLENVAKAIDMLESARLLVRDVPTDLLLTLGQLYLQERFTDSATKIFMDLYQRGILDNQRLDLLLESLLALGDGDNALKFAELLLKSEPESAQALFYSAQAADFTGDLDTALRHVEKATKLDGSLGKAFLLLGDLQLRAGQVDDALNALRIARSFSGLQVDALRLELELWFQQENWSEALSTLETLSQVDPNNSWDGLIDSVLDLIHRQEQ